MKNRDLLVAVSAGALGLLAGCAQNTPVAGAPSRSQTIAMSESARWTANIQSVMQSRGEVVQTTRDRSYGSAIWTRGDRPSLTSIALTFNYTGSDRYLSWAILSGSCGTPALPIIPMSNFPELQIGGGGRAQVSSSLPVEFPTSGSYHIEVYRSRQQGIDALIACGNLKLVG
ncbi:MAG: hypothetical protein Q7S20_13220 [Gemmatimonadaceae bacterium]|nr:hypothetical protein [Gemmatimonadaceae bacterium]